MANWCCIDVKFKAPSNEKAKWLQKGLEAVIDAHNQLNEMACIGGVWIKDCHVAIEEEIDKDKGSCDMLISGEVKWSITDFDARALAEYLYGHGVDTAITIDYEELGCCLKGTLTVNASKGIMKCKYLKQEDWPWANNPLETQEDWDKFYEELNQALEEKGVIAERETGNILPDKEIMRAEVYNRAKHPETQDEKKNKEHTCHCEKCTCDKHS